MGNSCLCYGAFGNPDHFLRIGFPQSIISKNNKEVVWMTQNNICIIKRDSNIKTPTK